MKTKKAKWLTVGMCASLFALGATSQASLSIGFGSGSTWDSSSFGGSANNNGWDNSGVWGGKTTLAVGSESVDVTISISTVGSAVGYHSGFHGGFNPNHNYLVTSTTFNGTAGTSSPALVYALNNDYSAFGSSFANYGVLTIEFSKPILYLSTLTIGDIDSASSGNWTDVVAAESWLNGVSVASSTLTSNGSPYNKWDTSTFSDKTFTAGQILGLSQADNDQDFAEGDFNFASAVTKINLYYWNDGSAGAEHAVYLPDITIDIPEPSSVSLMAGIGGLVLLTRRAFRR